MKKVLIACFLVFIVAYAAVVTWKMVEANKMTAAPPPAAELAAVTFSVTPPEGTPINQVVYLSGSVPALGSWEAAGLPLEPQTDGTHVGTVELIRGVEYGYKVTRGTWGTVERGPEGEEMPDRTLVVADDAQPPVKVPVEVAIWVDEGRSDPSRITYSGDIRLHKAFPTKQLESERDLIVYLPPGYDQSPDRRYPVLYMQDGQNIFDASTAFAGSEWGVDETAEQLIAQGGIPPIIIVGIYNTEQRTEEFTPGQKAATYGDFVVNEVKPFIDKHYRTLTDRENTGLIGSGLGAIVTLDMARQHRDTFGLIGALSPWDWDGTPEMLESWDADPSWMTDTRFWIDAADLASRLAAAGLTEGSDYAVVEITADPPNEDDWGRHIGDGMVFLFGQ